MIAVEDTYLGTPENLDEAVTFVEAPVLDDDFPADVDDRSDDPLAYGLDRGESECIWLANELGADLLLTDEFNTTNYLFVTLALDDRNILFTTPHVLCTLATTDVLPTEYVAAALTYYIETKGWDRQYIAHLRQQYLY